MARSKLLINARVSVRVPRALLQRVLDETLEQFGPRAATEVSVAFVAPRSIANLNRIYRGKRGATDVLSFSFWRGHEKTKLRPIVLGEVIIAPAVAEQRAARYGHGLSVEIGLLFLHGLLHVLGLDHEKSAAGKARMRRAEAAIAGRIPALAAVHAGQGLLVRELAA
ncbi:MAG: rRNA maturation RNase YbeY [Candidatus Andersenbacteria bacterium]